MQDNRQIYIISGLGADERAFQFLKLDFINRVKHISWITPYKNEKLETYSNRIIERNSIQENSVLIGLSFGGVVAVEISKQIKLSKVILISSVRNKRDLPLSFRFYGRFGLTKLIPRKALGKSNYFVEKVFGVTNDWEKQLLGKVLTDTDTYFAKWAISKISNWKESNKNENVVRVHGNIDKLIPLKNQVDYVIDNGSHFMIVQKSEEISKILNYEINKENV